MPATDERRAILVPTVSLIRMERGHHDLPPADGFTVALTVEPTSFVRRTAVHRGHYRVGRSFCCLRRPAASVSIDIVGSPTSALVIAIPRPWLEAHLDGTGASLSPGDAMVECVDPALTHLAEKVASHSGAGRDPLCAETLHHALVLHLLTRHGRNADRVPGPPMSRMRAVLDHIEHNLSGALSLDDLAAVAGAGRFGFARAFARAMGLPPHRYVMARRARAAVELIQAGEASLSEIALATGFCDQAHMSRWVSREIGIPPARLARASLPDRP